MNSFFEELKRRKVYRVAIAYIVAGWALAQGLAQVLPVFDISNSVIRVVIALMLIGFPVALVLAWVFDFTAQGIKTTPSIAAGSHRRRNLAFLIASGIVIAAAAGFFVLPRAAAHKVDKSIAVLPFENFSDEKENAYFADGIQDDILTNLSKIGDLKVISRTSVMSYRGHAPNVREIGKTLGVSTILEGSVRRAGNRVRVNVQLIDTNTDRHIWANDYDRDLTDVFAIQTDLAQKIANELSAKLSPTEKAQIENKPTQNGEAYLAFVRAHDLQSSSYDDLSKLKQSEEMYERATTLDPNFALALARYSQLESWIVHSFDRTAARREKARSLAIQAEQLQPELPEAHLALGFVYYYIDNNFGAAASEFEIAQQGLPNESEVYLALGAIQRRQGRWAESNASLEKAVALNPKDTWSMQNLAINYEMQRNWDAANKVLDRALAIAPDAFGLIEIKCKVPIEERGDFSIAQKFLNSLDVRRLSPEIQGQVANGRVQMFIFLRQYSEAVQVADEIPDSLLSAYPGGLCGKYTIVGVAKKAIGDDVGAHAVFEKAKQFAENDVKQTPDDAGAHTRLAEALAWLGQKDAAFLEIKRAQDLLPESKDAFDGPQVSNSAAEIHAIFGDAAGAVQILDGLLQRPSNVTVATLKLNPVWDPIRNDPGFKALIEKYGAKA